MSAAAPACSRSPVRAVDIDPVAVETTTANAAANGVELEAFVGDAARDWLPEASVATVNVLLRPVEKILQRLEADVAITSGYLDRERPAHPGWVHESHVAADGWAADAFSRRSAANRLPSATV